jgi:hypothetical protein
MVVVRKQKRSDRKHYAHIRRRLGSVFQTYVRETGITICELERFGITRIRDFSNPQKCKSVSINKAIDILVCVGLSVKLTFKGGGIVIDKDGLTTVDCTEYLINHLQHQIHRFSSTEAFLKIAKISNSIYRNWERSDYSGVLLDKLVHSMSLIGSPVSISVYRPDKSVICSDVE